jgi:hypothetical protein
LRSRQPAIRQLDAFVILSEHKAPHFAKSSNEALDLNQVLRHFKKKRISSFFVKNPLMP